MSNGIETKNNVEEPINNGTEKPSEAVNNYKKAAKEIWEVENAEETRLKGRYSFLSDGDIADAIAPSKEKEAQELKLVEKEEGELNAPYKKALTEFGNTVMSENGSESPNVAMGQNEEKIPLLQTMWKSKEELNADGYVSEGSNSQADKKRDSLLGQ